MLPGIGGVSGAVAPSPTLMQAITSLGLTSGLKLCLDAGDNVSVVTSSQTSWLDRSGGGYDFFRGTTAASQSSDPTFNGTPGGQSVNEYYSFDGGDVFTYDTTNETWMENLHKNSAIWAFGMWVYLPASSSDNRELFGTSSRVAQGVGGRVTSADVLRVSILKEPNTTVLALESTATVTENAWNFVSGQINEPAGTGFLQVNGTQEDQTTTYPSPSTLAAYSTLQLAASGTTASSAIPIVSGSRMAGVAMWESAAPTKAQMLSLYNATRTRFGV